LLARTSVNAPTWPVAHSEIEPYFQTLQRWLGITAGSFDLGSMRERQHSLSALEFADWAPRLSKWIAFDKRNLATAWNKDFTRYQAVEVWLNAETQDWQVSGSAGNRTVGEIVARSDNGRILRVHPKCLVIAAGALESARIVLELNDAAGFLSAGVAASAGRFLHDHVSVRIARLHRTDGTGFEEMFAPVFEGPTMRSLRMELAPDVLMAEGLPALYAHFVAETAVDGGFAVIRDCLRSAQRRNLRDFFKSTLRVPHALPDVIKVIHGRFVNRRLVFPANSELFLHIDFEQAPRRENRVYLDQSQTGVRRALRIDWDLDDDVPRIARSVQTRFERFWKLNQLNRVARLEFIDFGNASERWAHNVHDIYHPAGTTRMAVDPAEGVVDPNLKIHGTGNAYVVGTSVFPSMGAANPTFTAMALALRLADHIDGAALIDPAIRAA
jgi:choline dehydrogenase-like flavoprotein